MFIRKIYLISLWLSSCALASGAVALNVDDTRHLLTRAGFAPAAHEFKEFQNLDREQAVDKIIAGIRQNAITPAPSLMFEQFYEASQASEPEKSGCTLLTDELKTNTPQDFYDRRYAEHYAMKRWWWTEMINTPSPLTERLTLLWHDHFATGFLAWSIPQFYNNRTLRSLGASDFKTLALAMLRDPAMIYYLDNYKNLDSSPNENLAREFLELFTMGEGNYSQQDIKSLAKVLAGHGIAKEGCQYRFDKSQAFNGEVTLLGRRGKFSLEQAVDIIFEDPMVSAFIVKRFWIEFVSPTYTDKQIQPLAKAFREHNYDIRFLLKRVLTHKEFWAESNRALLVKSPVELLVGMTRSFGIWMPDPDMVIADSKVIGHDLFVPPNVAGWQENAGWVSPLSVVLRSIAIDRVWRAEGNIKQLRREYGELTDGLLIRASSRQHPGRDPCSFNIFVNGRLVDHVTLEMGDKEDLKKGFGIIQTPEMIYIPASDLPDKIATVTIEYKVDNNAHSDGNISLLMIHWLEYKGLRYSSNLARQLVTDPNHKNEKTPLGMLANSSNLIFDLQYISKKYRKLTKDKRVFMAYNTVTPLISELYSFGHEQPMPLAPAGLAFNALPLDSVSGFKSLAKAQDVTIGGVPMLAILPKLSSLTEAEAVAMNPLQALSLSPYYQLK